jgi:hypothetical protein
MRVATALLIVSVIVVVKAVLIGLVYWRRAETLGHPAHIGADSWTGLIGVVATCIAIAATVYIAGRQHNGSRTP